nr:hypothetical protein [uncultured Methanobacterium sp.]
MSNLENDSTDSFNSKVVNGEVLLEVMNGNKSTPKVKWSGNLSPYQYDPEEDEFPEGWGLTQLDDGQIVETFIFAGPAAAYIISKKEAIKQIISFKKYELLEKYELTNDLYNIVKEQVN